MMFYILLAVTITVTVLVYQKSRTDKSATAAGTFICAAFINFFILAISFSVMVGSSTPETVVLSERVYTIAPESQAEIGDSNISLVFVDDQGVTKATQTSFDSISMVSNPTEIVIREVSYEYGTSILPWGASEASVEVIGR